ncbi:MAG: ferric reductase-like transmembrane domain-containing protein [Hyphomonadaceae bacterium]|nr:ferric reductase-like transmembrane domain-containing protein [Hyphomonadaceae bacterium]
MAGDYRLVHWTPFKTLTDLALGIGVAAFLGASVAGALASAPPGQSPSEIQVLIRAFGAGAFALLTVILAIGPLARLSPRFLPLLYNRRHFGVTCFALAATHAGLTLLWHQGFSDLNPLIALLVSNPRYDAIQGFPFETLGLAALGVLFVMAATSHDFWNATLGPAAWKTLHMGVYGAYALAVGHVMLGAVQGDKGPAYPVVVGAGAALLAALHVYAGAREARRDRATAAPDGEGWIRVGPGGDIPDARAHIVTPPAGEKIAVFRDGATIFALSNVCRHQGGPLGEGRIVDGCVTCPWHGFQYQRDGQSPAPFKERIATYRTRIMDGVVYVHATPLPPGTDTPPSLLPARPAP